MSKGPSREWYHIFRHGKETRIYTYSMLMEVSEDYKVAKCKILTKKKKKGINMYDEYNVITGVSGQLYVTNVYGETISNSIDYVDTIQINITLINTVIMGHIKDIIDSFATTELALFTTIDGTNVIAAHNIFITSKQEKEIIEESSGEIPPKLYSLLLGRETFEDYFRRMRPVSNAPWK